MNGIITKKAGRNGRPRYFASVDFGSLPARRCRPCGKRGVVWPTGSVPDVCPRCGGPLEDSEERRRRGIGGFDTKKAAQAAIRIAIGAIERGAFVEPSKATFGEYLLAWWDGRDVKPSTKAAQGHLIRRHVIPRRGHVRLQELQPDHLNGLYAELRAHTKLAPASIQKVHTIIHRALADAVRRGYVVRNVADLADRPRAARPEMKVWTAEELRRFLDHIKDHRLFPAYVLAATTGARRGEVLGLTWSRLDLDQGTMKVAQTLVSVDYELHVVTPKTDAGRRTVPLDPATVAILRRWRARQSEERLAWGPGYEDSGFVFTREDGRPVHPDTFAQTFDRHVRAAGLPTIRLHDLRHTAATLMLRAGVPVKVVSERLGHADIATTLRIYVHTDAEQHQAAAGAMGALILGGGGS